MLPGLTSILLLAISIAALGLGPLLYRWLRAHDWALQALDGVVTVGVGGLVLLHVLPPAFSAGGFPTVVFLIFGLVLPTMMERLQHGNFDKAHRAATFFASLALIIHSITDGLALSQADHSETFAIALAVVLHRLPVGLAIWMVFRPSQGVKVAWAIFAMILVGTLVGFVAGPPVLTALEGEAFAWAQAFVAGSLLHVIFHAHEHDHDHAHGHAHGHGHTHSPSKSAALAPRPVALAPPAALVASFKVGESPLKLSAAAPAPCAHCGTPDDWDAPGLRGWQRARRFLGVESIRSHVPELLGAAIGAAIVWVVAWVERGGHEHHGDDELHGSALAEVDVHAIGHVHHEVHGEVLAGHVHISVIDAEGWERILELALGSAPYLLIGYVLAGLIGVVWRPASVAWLSSGPPWAQALRGVFYGAPLPVRACTVVPSFEEQLARGAGAPGAAAFLVASPHLRPEALLFSLPLLGLPLAGIRVSVVVFMAVVCAYVFARARVSSPHSLSSPPPSKARPSSLSVLSGLRHGLFRVVDDTAPWVLAAFLTVGVVAPSSLAFFASWPMSLELLFFAVLGIPVYLCSSAAMPVSALLIAAGVSPGAALVFILSGPVAYVAVFASFKMQVGRGWALGFLAVISALTILGGAVTDLAFVDLIVSTQPDLVHVEGEAHQHQAGNWVHWLALGALGVLFVGSLLRRGPRAWLNTVVAGDHG